MYSSAPRVDATTSLRPSYHQSWFKPKRAPDTGINCHKPDAPAWE